MRSATLPLNQPRVRRLRVINGNLRPVNNVKDSNLVRITDTFELEYLRMISLIFIVPKNTCVKFRIYMVLWVIFSNIENNQP